MVDNNEVALIHWVMSGTQICDSILTRTHRIKAIE